MTLRVRVGEKWQVLPWSWSVDWRLSRDNVDVMRWCRCLRRRRRCRRSGNNYDCRSCRPRSRAVQRRQTATDQRWRRRLGQYRPEPGCNRRRRVGLHCVDLVLEPVEARSEAQSQSGSLVRRRRRRWVVAAASLELSTGATQTYQARSLRLLLLYSISDKLFNGEDRRLKVTLGPVI